MDTILSVLLHDFLGQDLWLWLMFIAIVCVYCAAMSHFERQDMVAAERKAAEARAHD